MSGRTVQDSPTLQHWLGAALGAEYGSGLSNHLPMAMLALHRLGANEARMQAFAEGYASKLQPAAPPLAWPPGDAWTPRLGELAAEPAYRGLFMQWLALEDPNSVLHQVLPRLMQGCGGAAFHGLIRTAHAVESAHPQELVNALAYWACRWFDPGAQEVVPAGETDPAAVLRSLPVPRHALAGRLIFERMQAVAAQPGFAAAVARLQVTDSTLQQLACGAAQLYARSGNFTLLHLLTSAHALRVLMPWLDDDPTTTVQAYWRAFAAAWAASGASEAAPVKLLSWSQVVACALRADDEHVVKCVDSCREQFRVYGGDVWLAAASRACRA